MSKFVSMYEDYESKMQREGLFRLLYESFEIESALYPGSYVHIVPSFYFKTVVYVDMDKRAAKFFSSPDIHSYISKKKIYKGNTTVRFYPQDYSQELKEENNFFDLLISQYAGFVSMNCKKYLKSQGLLLVNNSHGDAGIAYLDPDFELIGVINNRAGKFVKSQKKLDQYFIPKKSDITHTISHLLSLKRGIGYTKTASHYLFQKK